MLLVGTLYITSLVFFLWSNVYLHCPHQINKLILLDTGIALWIPESWWRWATQVWDWTWTCRELSNSTVCLRLVCAATYRQKPVSAFTVWHWPDITEFSKYLKILILIIRPPYSAYWKCCFFCSSSFSKVTKTPGLRPMTKEDVGGIHSLLQANLRKFPLCPILSLQEVEHWLLPRENVIDTYVVEVWP